jgi:uncharacterized iron-regulated membrane protein
LLHRYVGLVMAVFLVVAGLTGTVLVFMEELDAAINPGLMRVAPPTTHVDPFEVARRVQQAQPDEVGWEVTFAVQPGHAVDRWHEVGDGKFVQRFINPYTGAILGDREWGNIRAGIVNLMPFIYRLHYSLALGDVGILIFGVVALLWTVDSFVGAYLTFPAKGPSDARTGVGLWMKRWLPAWLIKTNRLFSWVFTWHRASGLWLWGFLLVFAWSGVGLNLSTVYRPLMSQVFGMNDYIHDRLPELPKPHGPSPFSMAQAHAKAKHYMATELAQHDAELRREMSLAYAPEHQAFIYTVESSLDVSTRHPYTQVYLDSQSGALIGFQAPTGLAAGDSITSWLYALHFASVGGITYRLVVAVTGLLVVVLSVTGVWIWFRKRQKRAKGTSAPAGPSVSPTANLELSA